MSAVAVAASTTWKVYPVIRRSTRWNVAKPILRCLPGACCGCGCRRATGATLVISGLDTAFDNNMNGQLYCPVTRGSSLYYPRFDGTYTAAAPVPGGWPGSPCVYQFGWYYYSNTSGTIVQNWYFTWSRGVNPTTGVVTDAVSFGAETEGSNGGNYVCTNMFGGYNSTPYPTGYVTGKECCEAKTVTAVGVYGVIGFNNGLWTATLTPSCDSVPISHTLDGAAVHDDAIESPFALGQTLDSPPSDLKIKIGGCGCGQSASARKNLYRRKNPPPSS